MYTDPNSGIQVSVNPEAITSPSQGEAINEFMQTLMGVNKDEKPPRSECIDGWVEFDRLLGELVDLHADVVKYHIRHPHPHAKIIMNLKDVRIEQDYDVRTRTPIVKINFEVDVDGS